MPPAQLPCTEVATVHGKACKHADTFDSRDLLSNYAHLMLGLVQETQSRPVVKFCIEAAPRAPGVGQPCTGGALQNYILGRRSTCGSLSKLSELGWRIIAFCFRWLCPTATGRRGGPCRGGPTM